MEGVDSRTGEFKSPGGFVFGVQGWTWGEVRPKSITFFIDGTAKVCDQHGRPIKGTVFDKDGKRVEVLFAQTAPSNDDVPSEREKLASHMQVIEALAHERVDWTTLTWAGWPQIPYDQLKELKQLPPTPLEELAKIKDAKLRKDALKLRYETDMVAQEETATIEREIEEYRVKKV